MRIYKKHNNRFNSQDGHRRLSVPMWVVQRIPQGIVEWFLPQRRLCGDREEGGTTSCREPNGTCQTSNRTTQSENIFHGHSHSRSNYYYNNYYHLSPTFIFYLSTSLIVGEVKILGSLLYPPKTVVFSFSFVILIFYFSFPYMTLSIHF